MQEIQDEFKELGLNEQKETDEISFSSKVQHSILYGNKKCDPLDIKQKHPTVVIEEEEQLFNVGEVNNKEIRESFGQPDEQQMNPD